MHKWKKVTVVVDTRMRILTFNPHYKVCLSREKFAFKPNHALKTFRCICGFVTTNSKFSANSHHPLDTQKT